MEISLGPASVVSDNPNSAHSPHLIRFLYSFPPAETTHFLIILETFPPLRTFEALCLRVAMSISIVPVDDDADRCCCFIVTGEPFAATPCL